jgi:hypothetical protein
MKFIRVTMFGLSMLPVPVLSGCSAAPEVSSEKLTAVELAATTTTTFRLPCLATGNWNSAGVHTVGEYQIGHSLEHPDQQAAYFEFNFDPIKGRTLVSAFVEVIGSTDFNIEVVDAARCPGPCFKVGIAPQGPFTTAEIVNPSSNNSTSIYLDGDDGNRNQDLGYAWITNGLHQGLEFGADTYNTARLQEEITAGGDWVFWGRDDFDNGQSNVSDGACPACPGGVENYVWGDTNFTPAIVAIITVE